MGQNKLERFAAINTFENVFQMPENMQGKWNKHFGNNHPITLELACGKGEYTVEMAAAFPEKNFIGVDIKGNRIYVGAKKALQEDKKNVAFLRTQILELDRYFIKEEVSEIWITFPDPFLRESKAKNRLTHPRFLSIYQRLLPQGASIHLKTDSTELYEFTLETIREQQCTIHENIADVYKNGQNKGLLAIQTFYEKMHLIDNRTIKYLRFSLPIKPISIPEK